MPLSGSRRALAKQKTKRRKVRQELLKGVGVGRAPQALLGAAPIPCIRAGISHLCMALPFGLVACTNDVEVAALKIQPNLGENGSCQQPQMRANAPGLHVVAVRPGQQGMGQDP